MRRIFFLLCFPLLAAAQPPRSPVFTNPVQGPLRLSGTFGELRSNHFHTGIDVKGGMGVPILAVGEGYVARIKVQSGGYGNVLYLQHPNGYTSVYAHLNAFHPDIAEYVKEEQYARESFELDVRPPAGQFSFRQGDEIGKMGTTGFSFGPHLHFEMRITDGDMPVNPLSLGFQVADQRSPRMHQIKLYTPSASGDQMVTRKLDLVVRDDIYQPSEDTLRIAGEQLGVAIRVFDHMDGVRNWNGIYALELRQDGQQRYFFQADSIRFEQTRYLNAHLDYYENEIRDLDFHRCFLLPGNNLEMYNRKVGDGLIDLAADRIHRIDIMAYDWAGNQSSCTFWVERAGAAPSASLVNYQYIIRHDQPTQIREFYLEADFLPGTFYQDFLLTYDRTESYADGQLAPMHSLHHEGVPVHRSFQLAIRPTLQPDKLRNKMIIAHCPQKKSGEYVNWGGEWNGEMLTANVRTLGDFTIMVDTVPPEIKAERFSTDMRGWSQMQFKVDDNFSTADEASGLRYRAQVDGQWILLAYDLKNDLLVHVFDGSIGPGKHELVLEVMDHLDNRAVLRRTFRR